MTRDIGQVAFCITQPRLRWVLSRRPAINPAFAIAEAVWILAGRRDSLFVNFFNRSLPQFAGEGEVYHGAYGYRLRHSHGFDQLDAAYRTLSSNRLSRQVVLQIWDSQTDLPAADGRPRAPDIPCNVVAMLKMHRDCLEWTQVMRSNDIFRGLPYNIVQFTILQEVIAGWLGAGVGDFHLFTDSLHAYEADLADLRNAQIGDISFANTDSLSLPKEESDRAISELVSYIEQIIQRGVDSRALVAMLHDNDLPQAYRNLLCILVAETLRRRKDEHAATLVDDHCTDVLLRSAWVNWQSRAMRAANEQRTPV